MEDNNSYQDYWGSVRGIVEDIKELILNGDITEVDEIMTHADESVDGSQWVIYTYRNMACLMHSRNESAYFEEYGQLDSSDFSDAMQKMAYAAMRQDVYDELGDLDDLLEDNAPAEGEEGESEDED